MNEGSDIIKSSLACYLQNIEGDIITLCAKELKKMDDTHSRGSKCIDSIEDTPNTRKHIKGSSLHEINEMINNDHRWRVIEINLEDYFKEEFSKWDKIERGVMDPNKRNHREKFNEYMNEMLDSFPIELMMANMSESTVTEKS